jgi:hypothetical protein
MNFIILSQARSGSSLLAEMLNSHTAIHCDGEIFNEKHFKGRWGKIKQLIAHYWPTLIVWYHQHIQKKPNYGFKLLLSQVKNPEKFVDALHKKGFIIFDLRRNNEFNKAISGSIAISTKKWSVRSAEERIPSIVEIKPELLFARLGLAEKEKSLQNKIVTDKTCFKINYEDDLMDETKQAEFAKRICIHMQIPIEPLEGECIITDERPLSERITNYKELMELVAASPYAGYIPR